MFVNFNKYTTSKQDVSNRGNWGRREVRKNSLYFLLIFFSVNLKLFLKIVCHWCISYGNKWPQNLSWVDNYIACSLKLFLFRNIALTNHKSLIQWTQHQPQSWRWGQKLLCLSYCLWHPSSLSNPNNPFNGKKKKNNENAG